MKYLILFALLFSCSREPYKKFSGKTMGTTYSIKYKNSGIDELKIKAEVDNLLAEVNRQMSTYIPTSEISQFNQSKNDMWFSVSPDFFFVTEEALEVAKKTKGQFDPTVGPLVNLWGFGPKGSKKKPNDIEIKAALKKIGYQNIELNPVANKIRKKNIDLYLDLSASAKGFGVDKVVYFLEKRNIKNFMVEIGGEIRVKGVGPHGAWSIAIESPGKNERSIHKILKLDDIAIATSGDYRNFFKENGNLYSHSIDTKTGMPVRHNLTSVSVLMKKASLADSWATALMVIGGEKAYDYAHSNNIKAYFIYKQNDDFVVRSTKAFDAYFEKVVK